MMRDMQDQCVAHIDDARHTSQCIVHRLLGVCILLVALVCYGVLDASDCYSRVFISPMRDEHIFD